MSILLGFVLSFFIQAPKWEPPRFISRDVRGGIETIYVEQILPDGRKIVTAMTQWKHPGDLILLYVRYNNGSIASVTSNRPPCGSHGEGFSAIHPGPCAEQ